MAYEYRAIAPRRRYRASLRRPFRSLLAAQIWRIPLARHDDRFDSARCQHASSGRDADVDCWRCAQYAAWLLHAVGRRCLIGRIATREAADFAARRWCRMPSRVFAGRSGRGADTPIWQAVSRYGIFFGAMRQGPRRYSLAAAITFRGKSASRGHAMLSMLVSTPVLAAVIALADAFSS